MKKIMYIAAFASAMVVGANAALITNGDFDSTLDLTWASDRVANTQAELNGWYSSVKAAPDGNGAYIEAITGYGSGAVLALKATLADNYFQQTLAGVDAGIGEITVDYDSGIRYHSSYSSAVRDITLRVSLWDTTTDTELAGSDVVTAYSASETSLHARSHILTYDATGLDGNTLAVRFTNTTPTASVYDNGSAAVIDNINVIPEPATLGMVAVFGGGIIFIRRKLAM